MDGNNLVWSSVLIFTGEPGIIHSTMGLLKVSVSVWPLSLTSQNLKPQTTACRRSCIIGLHSLPTTTKVIEKSKSTPY